MYHKNNPIDKTRKPDSIKFKLKLTDNTKKRRYCKHRKSCIRKHVSNNLKNL